MFLSFLVLIFILIPTLLLGRCLFLVLNLVFTTALLLFFIIIDYFFIIIFYAALLLGCLWMLENHRWRDGDAGEKKLSHLMFFLLKWQDGWWVENIWLDAFPVQKAMLMIKNLSSSPTPSNVQFLLKGIPPQKKFSRPNLLFYSNEVS